MTPEVLDGLLGALGVERRRVEDAFVCTVPTGRARVLVVVRVLAAGGGFELLEMRAPRLAEVEAGAREEAASAINGMNVRLGLGKLALDPADGEVYLSWGVPAHAGADAGWLGRALGVLVSAVTAVAGDVAGLPGVKAEPSAEGHAGEAGAGDELSVAAPDVPGELAGEVQELARLAPAIAPEDVDRGTELARSLIPRVDRTRYGELWGAVQGTLGGLLVRRYERLNLEADSGAAEAGAVPGPVGYDPDQPGQPAQQALREAEP